MLEIVSWIAVACSQKRRAELTALVTRLTVDVIMQQVSLVSFHFLSLLYSATAADSLSLWGTGQLLTSQGCAYSLLLSVSPSYTY
jgi:hypothetical protein